MDIAHLLWPISGWETAVNSKDEVSALLERAAVLTSVRPPEQEEGNTPVTHTHIPTYRSAVCTHSAPLPTGPLLTQPLSGRWNVEVQTEVATHKRSQHGPRESHSSPAPWDPFQQGWWGECL